MLAFQALAYYTKTLTYNEKDESAYLNRAITKVSWNSLLPHPVKQNLVNENGLFSVHR